VPWRLIGERVEVVVAEGRVRILHAGREVAVHGEVAGRRQRIREAGHFHGIAGLARPNAAEEAAAAAPPAAPTLLRPLAEYEDLAGGSWR